MKRQWVPTLIGGLLVVAIVAILASVTARAPKHAAMQRILNSRSEIRLALTIEYSSGQIAREEYNMVNLNGASSARYTGTNRSGLTIKLATLPRESFDVSFLFGKVVTDGVWELEDRPLRGDKTRIYRVWIHQLIDGASGTHAFQFTDPHYWATIGGREFHLHLDRTKPIPNLLQMNSTSRIEPRYGRVLDDLLQYGSPAFRAKIAQAQVRLRSKS